jgi:hypothetical protein
MSERPPEQEAVRTTIVGGRPPGSGKPVGPIPRGIEVLVKKAAVDAEFRQILLDRRASAAGEIDLKLEPSETAMLNAVPTAQLEAIIARTTVHPKQRPAFLGRVAAVMIVALGASTVGCGRSDDARATDGVRPDRPGETQPTKGISPDRPEKDATEAVEEDGTDSDSGSDAGPSKPPTTTRGIQPDRPGSERE